MVADVAGTITYALQPPRKRRLCAHLHSRAAGGLPAREARRRARASYRNYARMIIDTIWIHAIRLDEMFEHGYIDGVENLHSTRDAGRGGILVLAHFGSWDIAASMALAAGHPVTTVMAPGGHAVDHRAAGLVAQGEADGALRTGRSGARAAPRAAPRSLGGHPHRHPRGRPDHRGPLLQRPGASSAPGRLPWPGSPGHRWCRSAAGAPTPATTSTSARPSIPTARTTSRR